MKKTSPSPASSVELIDGPFVFWALERLKSTLGETSLRLNYPELRAIFSEERAARGYRPSERALAFISKDPGSDVQGRFVLALERSGYVVHAVDYRELFVSPTSSAERKDPPIVTVSAWLGYALGRLSGAESPHVIVLSGGFDVYGPMSDVVRRGGRVCLAYFRSLLDSRWERVLGPAGKRGPAEIDFMDLTPHCGRLFGIELPEGGGETHISSALDLI